MKLSSDSMDVYGMTDIGHVKKQNEDHFFIASLQKTMSVIGTSLPTPARISQRLTTDALLLVVADGVGGLAGGELASSTAIEAIARYIGAISGCYYNLDVDEEMMFLRELNHSINQCHKEVQRRLGGSKQGPATTLTMVHLVWPRAYIVHVGDSRCYYQHNGVLRQITRDQTLAEDYIEQGLMNEKEVKKRRLDNVLTSAVGAAIRPVIGLVDLDPADTLLLCSDGLNKHVSDEEIQQLLAQNLSSEESCRRLLEQTLAGGAHDNVSIIVARQSDAANARHP